MFGLKFLSELYNISYSAIAEACEISKAGVQRWMEKEKIPKEKHVKILSGVFGVDEKYINKQLTVLEQEGLRRDKVLKETVNASEFFKYQYTTEIDGQEVQLEEIVIDEDDRLAIELNTYETSLIKTVEYVMASVRVNEVSISKEEKDITKAKQVLEWLIELADVAKTDWKDGSVVELMLCAVYQQITGEPRGLFDDKQERFINKVITAINDYNKEM